MAITAEERRAAISWSVLALFMFGLRQYVVGFTNQIPGLDSFAVLGLVFVSSSFQVLFDLPSILGRYGSLFFAEKSTAGDDYVSMDEVEVSMGTKVASIMSGVLSAVAVVFLKLSFAQDPKDSGPLMALITMDVVFVSIYCHFVYGEVLSGKQFFAVLCAAVGSMIMGFGGKSGVDVAGQRNDLIGGMFWALFGSFSFGSSVICTRMGMRGGLAAKSNTIGQLTGTFTFGVLFLLYSMYNGGLVDTFFPLQERYFVWVLCCCAGAMNYLGTFGIANALAYPMTGVCIAIFGSCDVVVLLCVALQTQSWPAPQILFGMMVQEMVTTVSSALVSLLGGSAASAENDEFPPPLSAFSRKGLIEA